MKFKYINRKKLLIILLSGFILTSISGCKKNTMDESTNYNSQSKIESETIINESQNNASKNESSTIKNEDNNPDTNTNEKQTNQNNNSITQYSENDIVVINEFENLEKEIDEILQNDKEFLTAAKGIFITTVDFIFYDSEINGVKFDELTEEGKQKILEITNRIDTKIENKYPNYKDTISETAKNALNKASELIKEGATDINSFAKEKLGDDNYNSLIEAKDELVYYTKNAVGIIGDFSSNLYHSGKEKIKNWYEEFKNKNTSN